MLHNVLGAVECQFKSRSVGNVFVKASVTHVYGPFVAWMSIKKAYCLKDRAHYMMRLSHHVYLLLCTPVIVTRALTPKTV